VLGVDSSEGYIEFARKQIQDPRIAFRLGDAQALPVESAAYDVVVSGLVVNFIPQLSQALSEMIRAVRIGGLLQHMCGITQAKCNSYATSGMLLSHLTGQYWL
jgi:ubiquinone/menaquinone biosynthesis C-methylase UbiE